MDYTDGIAIYAAVLSTFVFLWGVNNARSKLSVNIIHAVSEKSEMGVNIAIRNSSSHKVYVTSISLVYPYRETTLLDKFKHTWECKRLDNYINWVHDSLIFEDIETGLPLSIEPGNSHYIFIPEEKIKEFSSKCLENKFAAVVQDALWRNKYSQVFKF